jgi:hypothetical protein
MVNGRASRACAYGRGSVATMVKSAGYAPAHHSMASPNVAVFLLRVRELHHLSQKQAARRAGISGGAPRRRRV